MRRCKSFNEIREQDEDFADKEAADIDGQNFISAPNSPREKDMLHNPFFLGRISELKRVYKMRD